MTDTERIINRDDRRRTSPATRKMMDAWIAEKHPEPAADLYDDSHIYVVPDQNGRVSKGKTEFGWDWTSAWIGTLGTLVFLALVAWAMGVL